MLLHECFAGGFVINLPERTDRRREVERELARAGLPAGWAEFYPAVRPAAAGDFPSVGARGCFLSHLGALRLALARGWANVLVMEDDLAIDPALAADAAPVAAALGGGGWDFAYLGHLLPAAPGGATFRPHTGPIVNAHFFAVSGRCLPALVGFLDTVLSRPAGHPDGGPMHVDGAYSTFRAQHPEVVTLVAARSLGGQRSSRSDITPSWIDRWSWLQGPAAAARRVKRWLR